MTGEHRCFITLFATACLFGAFFSVVTCGTAEKMCIMTVRHDEITNCINAVRATSGNDMEEGR